MNDKYDFDPSVAGVDNGHLYGMPYPADEAYITALPFAWEPTVSYGRGTSKGPAAILKASPQLDIFDSEIKDIWKFCPGYLKSFEKKISRLNRKAVPAAKKYINAIQHLKDSSKNPRVQRWLDTVNRLSKEADLIAYEESVRQLSLGKIPVVLGGEHSCAFPLIRAFADSGENFGILHFDAHMDLRKEYEGFIYSHASVMRHAMELSQVEKLVSCGIRDYCEEEWDFVQNNKDRVNLFDDKRLSAMKYNGKNWDEICEEIIKALPDNVYISFDVDALMPSYCPSTGTPVPGGLEYNEAVYLLRKLSASGKRVIGFDLCETASNKYNGEYDANVASRILFQLTLALVKSNKKHFSI